MASARERRCPRIAAKNLVLVFPPAYGRVSLKELVFQILSKPYFAFEDYTHTCALARRFHRQIERARVVPWRIPCDAKLIPSYARCSERISTHIESRRTFA